MIFISYMYSLLRILLFALSPGSFSLASCVCFIDSYKLRPLSLFVRLHPIQLSNAVVLCGFNFPVIVEFCYSCFIIFDLKKLKFYNFWKWNFVVWKFELSIIVVISRLSPEQWVTSRDKVLMTLSDILGPAYIASASSVIW